eukprot:TRINITY_DN2496_c0_g1_i1.p5 TRINITY_DN2496_c0_g1~~TRINITY_DN2496_c0_g1_i1.p5  ORF type:complete len:118 (-),score=21.49 TRINITY_DN2496_c0_g1_i1:488-841(-)
MGLLWTFFFFNDTGTTEIYTILFVGSVRCVQETANGQMGVANDCRTPLTYALATLPTQGTVSATSAGAFTYTPTTNAVGRDSFNYTVFNVDGTGTGTVSIVIRGESTTLPWLMLLLE